MSWLNWPNRITIARTLLIAPLVICLLNLNEWGPARRTALALWILMGAGDVLDGYLARRFGEATAVGRFLDPLGDKLMVTAAVILLAFDATSIRGYELPNWVPVIVIGKDLVTVIGFGLVQWVTHGKWSIRPRPLGKACTVLQWWMVLAVLVWPDMPSWWRWTAAGSWWLVAAAALAAAADYVRVGNRFAAAAPEE